MRDARRFTVFAYVLLLLLGIFMIFPFLWMFFSSFKNSEEVYNLAFFPQEPNFDNYIYIFTSRYSRFTIWFMNSLFIAIVTTSSVLFFDSLLGYTLAKFNFPGKKNNLCGDHKHADDPH